MELLLLPRREIECYMLFPALYAGSRLEGEVPDAGQSSVSDQVRRFSRTTKCIVRDIFGNRSITLSARSILKTYIQQHHEKWPRTHVMNFSISTQTYALQTDHIKILIVIRSIFLSSKIKH